MMNTAKIDLHLHLDGSLNIYWAYERSLLRNTIDKDMSFEEFYNILYAHNKGHSAENFRKFEIVCDVLQTYEDLFDATYDLCRRLDDLGLIYAEIRFASQQHCKLGLSQLDSLKAVIDGGYKAMEDFDIRIGIINCLSVSGISQSILVCTMQFLYSLGGILRIDLMHKRRIGALDRLYIISRFYT